jgi:hypothetical protein
MNKEWSELNKTMQLQLKKKESITSGIATLLALRKGLMEQMKDFRTELAAEDFSAMPYRNATGYHSKTVAYSLWHIFRIEDIVAHTLIAGDQQVFFQGDYQRKINSPIITTGNELAGEEIVDFSKALCLDELYAYMDEVNAASTKILENLAYEDIKRKIPDEKREVLENLGVVSKDEKAWWLIDYWCGKDIKGLIQMPFSRHWIMHVEACIRIREKLLSAR